MKLRQFPFLRCFRWWKTVLWWIQSLLCWWSSEWRRTAWTFSHHWYRQYWVSAPLLQFQCHFMQLRMENPHQYDFRKQFHVESCLRKARLYHMAINCTSEVFWKLVEIFAYSNRYDLIATENTGWKLDVFCVPPPWKEKELGPPSGLNMNSSVLNSTESYWDEYSEQMLWRK